jgi:hypothetical protein
MSDHTSNCKLCNRSHMGGLSCFYGISKVDRKPITKSNPSKKKTSARKLLKNKYRLLLGRGESINANISFKQFVKNQSKRK